MMLATKAYLLVVKWLFDVSKLFDDSFLHQGGTLGG